MTRIEFNAFVEDHLKGRWRKWEPTPALLDDWYAILRYHSVEVVVGVIQAHFCSSKASYFEPKIHEVSSLLAQRRRSPTAGQDIPIYIPWVRCLEAPADHPDWVGREWLRSEYLFSGEANSQRKVGEAATRAARDIQQAHGGKWCGVVRPDGQLPDYHPDLPKHDAREWTQKYVLDGPDGPGKRFVMQNPGYFSRPARVPEVK